MYVKSMCLFFDSFPNLCNDFSIFLNLLNTYVLAGPDTVLDSGMQQDTRQDTVSVVCDHKIWSLWRIVIVYRKLQPR